MAIVYCLLCCCVRVRMCVQAEQVVPDFLEQIAATAYGSSFGTSTGEFGSTDTRVSCQPTYRVQRVYV